MKEWEDVAVLGLLINGTRQTARGKFLEVGWRGQHKGLYLVKVGDLRLAVKPSHVIRWSDYVPAEHDHKE